MNSNAVISPLMQSVGTYYDQDDKWGREAPPDDSVPPEIGRWIYNPINYDMIFI